MILCILLHGAIVISTSCIDLDAGVTQGQGYDIPCYLREIMALSYVLTSGPAAASCAFTPCTLGMGGRFCKASLLLGCGTPEPLATEAAACAAAARDAWDFGTALCGLAAGGRLPCCTSAATDGPARRCCCCDCCCFSRFGALEVTDAPDAEDPAGSATLGAGGAGTAAAATEGATTTAVGGVSL